MPTRAKNKQSRMKKMEEVAERELARFFITPKNFAESFRHINDKSNYSVSYKNLTKPKFYTPERLVEIIKTNPNKLIRRHAYWKLHQMYYTSVVLQYYQMKSALEITEKNTKGCDEGTLIKIRPENLLKLQINNWKRNMSAVKSQTFLDKWASRCRAAMEDVALFGNYELNRDAIIRKFILSMRGCESLRRVIIDSNFAKTRKDAYLFLSDPLGERTDKEFYELHLNDKEIQNIIERRLKLAEMEDYIDRSKKLLRDLNEMKSPKMKLPWQMMKDAKKKVEEKQRKMQNFEGSPEEKLIFMLKKCENPNLTLNELRNNMNLLRTPEQVKKEIEKHISFEKQFKKGLNDELLTQLGKSGRHLGDRRLGVKIAIKLAVNMDHEKLKSIVMRSENPTARKYAVNMLFEIAKFSETERDYKAMTNVFESIDYAATRCRSIPTIQTILNCFDNPKYQIEISKELNKPIDPNDKFEVSKGWHKKIICSLAAYSKLPEVRMTSLNSIKSDSIALCWIATHSNFKNSATEAMAHLAAKAKTDSSAKDALRKAMKRASPFINKSTIENAKKRLADKA
mgnify:CR=1 FL=1